MKSLTDDRGELDWEQNVGFFGLMPTDAGMDILDTTNQQRAPAPAGLSRSATWMIEKNWDYDNATVSDGVTFINISTHMRELAAGTKSLQDLEVGQP